MTTLGLMSKVMSKVVKEYLETSNGMFYRTRRILRTLLLLITVPKGAARFSKSVHFFRRNRKLAPKLDPKTSHFFEMEFENCLREMGKSSRQRWTIL